MSLIYCSSQQTLTSAHSENSQQGERGYHNLAAAKINKIPQKQTWLYDISESKSVTWVSKGVKTNASLRKRANLKSLTATNISYHLEAADLSVIVTSPLGAKHESFTGAWRRLLCS